MSWQPGPVGGSGDGPDHAAWLPGGGPLTRDARLPQFASDQGRDALLASARLALLADELSGPERRGPGATDDELVGLLRGWAAIESWAAGAKLGVIAELIRRDDAPRSGGCHGDLPDDWSPSLRHELAAALACSAQSAETTTWLAWELRARLPGVGASLNDGTLTLPKARAIVETFRYLSDGDAARAEALILHRLAGKTFPQVLRLAEQAALTVDPELATRRREQAQRKDARVTFFREMAGTAGLSGRDLPPDAALAAMASVNARAQEYGESGAFGATRTDVLRAYAYLDLLNGVTVAARITSAEAQDEGAEAAEALAWARARADRANAGADAGAADAARTATTADGGREAATGDRGQACEQGCGASGDDGERGYGVGLGGVGPEGAGPGEDTAPSEGAGRHAGVGSDVGAGPGEGTDSGEGSGAGGSREGSPWPGGPGTVTGMPATVPALRLRSLDLIVPLATLLGLAERPGEIQGFGLLDPALAREFAAAAVASAGTEICVTVTSPEGYAVGHGCARLERVSRSAAAAAPPGSASASFPARLNLTIPVAALSRLSGLTRHDADVWALIRRGSPGPPDGAGPPGYGMWTLVIPGGRRFTARLEEVPTLECDHRYETHGYQPSDRLRHLVQVRDGTCTFPPCNRHARESDFEHARPYDKGGRTCACNAGARSRACHRVKQSPGWQVTQPRPGWHQWTTPSGRSYVQEPKRYPA